VKSPPSKKRKKCGCDHPFQQTSATIQIRGRCAVEQQPSRSANRQLQGLLEDRGHRLQTYLHGQVATVVTLGEGKLFCPPPLAQVLSPCLQVVCLPGPAGRQLTRSRAEAITLAFSRRLQIQERMTHQVAAGISSEMQASGVLVLCRCTHTPPPTFWHGEHARNPEWLPRQQAIFGVLVLCFSTPPPPPTLTHTVPMTFPDIIHWQLCLGPNLSDTLSL